ncbi:MAG: cysteine--tRNA ligase [bacterium]
MQINLFNTQTMKKEELKPLEEGKVKMYVCGITAYDLSHIGHARSQIVFDVIQRFLKYRGGYDVVYVRNYTDIDDKIINKAKNEGVKFNEISEKYIKEFDKDMEILGIEEPTYRPKATEYIADMIEMVRVLIEKGHAYEIDGDVYFSVESFKEYGKLSKKPLEELLSGARVEVDERKKNPLDFALWKRRRYDYEPYWESPWGQGRPGWHLECSVMSSKLLGPSFDIHGGGLDLVFPHHENEIAQSEAYSGKPFVRYWLHNGFVNINKEKMSKSLGNVLTIRELTLRYHPEALKLFILSHHYRSPMDFDYEKIADAQVTLKRLYLSVKNWKEKISSVVATNGKIDDSLKNIAESFENDFDRAMADDFNTALALAAVHDYTKVVNKYFQEHLKRFDTDVAATINYAMEKLFSITKVLGILQETPEEFFEKALQMLLNEKSLTKGDIENLVEERRNARLTKDYAKADEIRKKLGELGIELEDTPQGTNYRVKV